MKKDKYLPLGTVVILKGATHRLSIIGFCLVDDGKGNNRQYDYVGVFYPEGFAGKDKILCFDHDDIEKVYAEGYSDDSEKEFKKKLVENAKFISIDEKCHYVSFDKINELLNKDNKNDE